MLGKGVVRRMPQAKRETFPCFAWQRTTLGKSLLNIARSTLLSKSVDREGVETEGEAKGAPRPKRICTAAPFPFQNCQDLSRPGSISRLLSS